MKYIAIIILSFFAGSALAQKDVRFPGSFKLEPSLLPGYIPATVDQRMREAGFTGNPLTTRAAAMKRQACRSCDPNVIEEVYVELYQRKSNKDEDAGVMVIAFATEKQLKASLEMLEAQGNVAYLTAGRYLINAWSDDSRSGQQHLEHMTAWYIKKLGARVYQAKESSDMVAATDVAEPTVAEAAEAEPGYTVDASVVADAAAVPAPGIAVKPGRKIKYLYVSGDITAFFDDGTVATVPGPLCRQRLSDLKQKAPVMTYTMEAGMFVLTEGPSEDAQDAIGLPGPDKNNRSSWPIVDFKETGSIPACK